MKTTIESTDLYQVIISQAKEKFITLQSKLNDKQNDTTRKND